VFEQSPARFGPNADTRPSVVKRLNYQPHAQAQRLPPPHEYHIRHHPSFTNHFFVRFSRAFRILPESGWT
jgi:hypothetical protein